MKTAILIIALTANAYAGDDERDRTRGGYAYSRETYSDTHTRDSDEWTTDTRPHSVPEPSSPLAMLVSAAVTLVTRRKRRHRIRERKIDVCSVWYR